MNKEDYKNKIIDLVFLKEKDISPQTKLDFKTVKNLFNEVLIYYYSGKYKEEEFLKIISRLSIMHEGREAEVETDHDKHFYILLDKPFEADGVFLKYYFTIEILNIQISKHIIKIGEEYNSLWNKLINDYRDLKKIFIINVIDEILLLKTIMIVLEDYFNNKFSEFFAYSILEDIVSKYPAIFFDIKDSKLSDLFLEIDELNYYMLTDLKNSEKIFSSLKSYYDQYKSNNW